MAEVAQLYQDLNTLLEDICQFLTDKAHYDKLSPLARKKADELIARSKKQILEIDKVTDNGAYVDMEPKEFIEEPNIYSCPEDEIVELPEDPYADLPAKDVSLDLKHGMLSWKYRFILTFAKTRRVFAAIHNNWLLIYNSEKDSKPFLTFNLEFYKAQEVVKSKSSSQDFELVCMTEEKKFYFLALTYKDMMQWTYRINKCHEMLNKSGDSNDSKFLQSVQPLEPQTHIYGNDDEDEESIYQDIEYRTAPDEVNIISTKAPDLPLRPVNKPNIPLPQIPTKVQLSSCDNAEDLGPSSDSATSFSDTDSEPDVYDILVTRKTR